MKKYIISIIVLFLLVVITGCSSTKEDTVLKELVDKINNCELVKEYKGYNIDITASIKKNTNNTLVITMVVGDDETSSVEFVKEGNILKNENFNTDYVMALIILVDSYGQMTGYEDGKIAENITAFNDEWEKYTLKKEGFEIIGDETKQITQVRIDLTKTIPLQDMKNFYLKTTEFDLIQEYVTEKSEGTQVGRIATISYDVRVGTKENIITVGEVEKLGEGAYKTILSALEVMYGEDVVNNFKKIYPEFKDKKVESGAFIIEKGYKPEGFVEEVFEDAEIITIRINNKKIK